MRIVSLNPNEPGLFAFGQEAVGVIAVGQMALGVVAIGQLARGVIAVGQLAVGVVAVGQLAIGVAHGTGMIGVGGEGKGLVLRWLPRADPPPKRGHEEPMDVELLRTGQVQEGWVRARLHGSGETLSLRTPEGAPLADVALDDASVKTSLAMAATVGRRDLLLRLRGRRKLADPGAGYREGARDEGLALDALEQQSWEPWEPGRLGALRREWREHPWRVPGRAAVLSFAVLMFLGVSLVPLLAHVFELDVLTPIANALFGGER